MISRYLIVLSVTVCSFLVPLAHSVTWDEPIIIDHRCTDITKIPDNWIDSARNKMAIFYTGGSHASQYAKGLQLVAELLGPEKYKVAYHTNKDGNDDMPDEPNALRVLNYGGDYLGASKLETIFNDQGGVINAAGHGWCDEICKRNPAGYLAAVEKAEQQFPDVAFWYATGIEDWDDNGVDPTVCRPNNDAIRDYCRDNNKVLFDFLGIDMTDDEGNFHDTPEEQFGDCNWCKSFCETNDCETNGLESQRHGHTHIYSCFRKGKAMWWMLARIAGWPGPETDPANVISKQPSKRSVPARDIINDAKQRGYRVRITDLNGRQITDTQKANGLSIITTYNKTGAIVKSSIGIIS